MYQRKIITLPLTAVLGAMFFTSGCGAVRETMPDRSAMEQLLISTAADRAVFEIPKPPFNGKNIMLDLSNLESYDKPYLVQRIKSTLRNAGARTVASEEEADMILEVASGALSVDRRDWMFGIPSLPLPVSVGGEPLAFPEVPLWKRVTYTGKAKLLFSPVDPQTGESPFEIPLCYGKANDSNYWVFLVGPIRRTDLPAATEKMTLQFRRR